MHEKLSFKEMEGQNLRVRLKLPGISLSARHGGRQKLQATVPRSTVPQIPTTGHAISCRVVGLPRCAPCSLAISCPLYVVLLGLVDDDCAGPCREWDLTSEGGNGKQGKKSAAL